MDFNGSGIITEENFLKSLLIYKMPFSQEEIKDFFKQAKYFKLMSDGSTGMDYEFFKKTFFAFRDSTAGQAIDQEKMDQQIRDRNDELLTMNGKSSNIKITEKLQAIEGAIRKKFANNYTSVRKAFLDTDTDYDGYLTAEDMAKFYGAPVDFKDMQLLLQNRDSRK
jgi:hypothetical protein